MSTTANPPSPQPFRLEMKVCQVNLTTKSVETRIISPEIVKKYLGGIGVLMEYLFQEMEPLTDPLGPNNILVFLTGLFSATNVPFSGRFTALTKSPLTGTIGESNSGGHWGPALRKTGFDALVFQGVAPELSSVVIRNDKVEIVETPDLQGLDTNETEDHFKKIYGKKTQVACIGPAGERLVLVSGIVTDKGRIAARCGVGAVMGSKRLKAVVVEGTHKPIIYDERGLNEAKKQFLSQLKKKPNRVERLLGNHKERFYPLLRKAKIRNFKLIASNRLIVDGLKTWGTSGSTAILTELGDAPIKNWSGSPNKDFPKKKSLRLEGDSITVHQIKRYACQSCPVACGGIMSYEDDERHLQETHKPEYETLAMFGTNLLNDDLGSIIALNDYCNRQGVDTISMGGLLAFAIEGLERQLLPREDFGELALTWGDPTNYLSFLEAICERRGIGDLFANGVDAVTAHYGIKDTEIAVSVRNQIVAAHDPRWKSTQIIPYLLDPSPGRHTPYIDLMKSYSNLTKDYKLDKSRSIFDYYMYQQVISTLGLCKFGLVSGNYPTLKFLQAVTGLDVGIEEVILVGERIFTLKHLFNLREGINPNNNRVSPRLLGDPPLKTGPLKNRRVETHNILSEFQTQLGWDPETAIPSQEHLSTLGLDQLGLFLDRS